MEDLDPLYQERDDAQLAPRLAEMTAKMNLETFERFIDEDCLCYHLRLPSRKWLLRASETAPEVEEALGHWNIKRNYLWGLMRDNAPKKYDTLRRTFLDKNFKDMEDKPRVIQKRLDIIVNSNIGSFPYAGTVQKIIDLVPEAAPKPEKRPIRYRKQKPPAPELS